MGQRESRSLRDGNQVAVEALDAFQRNCSLSAGQPDSSRCTQADSSRLREAEEPADTSSRHSAQLQSCASRARQPMSSKRGRPARRLARVRRREANSRSCSWCPESVCASCQSEVEWAQADRCRWACCTSASSLKSAERVSLPSQLTAAPSNERLVCSAGLFADELAALDRKRFYDADGRAERDARRLARRHNNQLVTSERMRHLTASSGGGLARDPASEQADRVGAARAPALRRSAATSELQQASISSGSSLASTLTLVSGVSAECDAAARDKDVSGAKLHTNTEPRTQVSSTIATGSATTSPDQLVCGSQKNVSSQQRATGDEISKSGELEAASPVTGAETVVGVKSSASLDRKSSAGRRQQQWREEGVKQFVEADRRPAPFESEQVSAGAARVTCLAWNELALKYGCKMSRKTSKQPIVSKSPDDRSDVHSYGGISLPARRPGEVANSSRSSCARHILCALLQTLFPIVGSLKNYSLPGDLATDLAAGFTVAVLHIPQGMAYGLLSGVDPIYGLYVSFIPVLIMSLMSSARHVSYGTFAVISMLLVNTIDNVRDSLSRELGPANASEPLVITDNHQPMSAGNLLVEPTGHTLLVEPPSAIEILACASLVCGLIHISMSLLRLGVLSLVFSDQLVSSFTTASAIHVFSSQIGGLFDLSLPPVHEELFKILRIWWNFARALLFDKFNGTTGLLSLCSILFLLFIKQWVEPALRRRWKRLICLPSELLLMAVLILCSWNFKLEQDYNVKTVGSVPTGLPELRAPRLELVPYVLKDCLTIALISYVINLSIARVYAKRYRYELDANQELFALGTANIVSSFFTCFPCASSLSRSSVQSSLNPRSQLSSLFSCALVILIICFFAHILHDLPRSTLSCIILVALKGILMQVRDLLDNWRLSKLDALVWIITFVSVIAFGVTHGLIMGICSSLSMVFIRLLTPNHSILGRLPDTEIYVDVDAFVECEQFERLKIFRFNSALCYLNRTQLKSKIEKLFPAIYKPKGFSAICAQYHQDQPASSNVSFLIIDCSAFSYCDQSGAATLVELIEDMENEKVTVYLAACPLKLIDMFTKMKNNKILSDNIYATISDAVRQVRHLLSSGQSTSSVDARRAASPSKSCDKTIINLT